MDVAATTRTTLIPDIQGSIVGALASNGALTRTGYQPFGENPSLTTAGFAYTARRLDPETAGSAAQPSGLYDYRARTYSPTWGRFLQPDPLGYAPDTNLYAYVGNDPLNGTDPSGLATYFLQAGGGIVGVLGGLFGGGIYVTTNNAYGLPDIGLFRVGGVAVGANAGVGVSVGYANGSTADFRGRTLNVDAGIGPVTGSVTFTPNGAQTFNNVVGASVGIALSPTAVGADLSSTTTTASGLLENLILPAFGLSPTQASPSLGGSGVPSAPQKMK